MCFSSTTTNSHSTFQKISAPHLPFISLLPTTSSAVAFQEVSAVPENLLEVLFLNNELEGCLPYEIGKLNKAVVFDVGGNKLTGPIPHSFACLEKMDRLNLAVNEFYGPVPEMVCDLPRLTNLSLSHNYFTQVGPMCMKLIKKKILDVRMNCILGLPGQRSAAECAKFFSKHKPCPNARSLSYIPCRKGGFSRSSLTSDQQSMAPAAAPITYDALIPRKHKLLL
ncbi:hypothetical protein OIU77_028806 [Salix suchowensis]|uniref:Leucine-rich repeat family protein n=1 Tax=Salix suchowensis TaxID=1278906 RepID=A0ABQ9BME0_9ROSI|nr:hypothetical protein OIU77_028806 [Salix suchowensis]